MLFDTNHILYMLISAFLTAGGLFFCRLYIKNTKWKDVVLRIFAILTVILHFSSLWVDYFTTGEAEVENTMLLPIYPCHIAMWLLLIVAFWRKKDSKVYKVLSEFTFYLGIVGGVIGLAFNEIYSNTPNLADWDTLKGMLSHSTMMFGAIYLLVGGYIRIRVDNVISVFFGLLLLLLDGFAIIGLHRAFGIDSPNCMYLLESPFPDIAWFNTYLLGLLGLLASFVITAVYEQIALKKEDRWYSKLNVWYKEHTSREEETRDKNIG